VDRPGSDAESEVTALERLRWIVFLHWTAGTLLYVLTLGQSLIGSLPGGPLMMTGFVAVVYGYTGAAALVIRGWSRTRRTPLSTIYRRVLNGLAVSDIVVLVSANHLAGGPDSPGLATVAVPMIVYGIVLPRRDAYLHAVFASALLGATFAGEHLGWLSRACPEIEGHACSGESVPFTLMQFGTVVFLMFLASYLTSFNGSSLRRQEAEARRLAEERGGLAQMRARLVSMASHEFRTPLTSILAAADTLDRFADRIPRERQREKLGKIRDQVRHLTRLLDDVLVLGRVESGRVTCSPEPIDLAALCREIVEETEQVTQATGRLVVDSAGLSSTVSLDPHLVRTVLGNLLSNAVKYSGAEETVRCALASEKGRVTIRVTDRGIGIPPEDQPHLFEPFHRACNVGQVAGSGLGLVITKKAVELHGGTIDVETSVGRGSTFLVTLPEGPSPTG